jgi:hypothetical protein
MTNPFDLAGYDNQNMGGLFSSIKKVVKKAVSAPVKAVSKIAESTKNLNKAVVAVAVNPTSTQAHKNLFAAQKANLTTTVSAPLRAADTVARAVKTALTPAAIENIRKKVSGEVRKNPIFMAAVMIAASFVIGPAVAALAAKFGVAATSTLVKGATALAKSASNDLIKAAHARAVTKDAMDKVNAQVAQIAKMNAELAKDPEYQATMVAMRKLGKSDAEIIAAWGNSQTGTRTAIAQVQAVLLPQVIDYLKADPTVPSDQVQALAVDIANKMAIDAVAEAKKTQVAPILTAASKEKPVTVPPTPVSTTAQAVTAQPTAPVTQIPFLPIAAIAASLLL